MAKDPLKECATCGKSWKQRAPEDATMCPYCGSTSVRDARMTDIASDARGGGGCGCALAVLLLLAALGAGGYYWYFHVRQPPPAPSAPAAPRSQPEPEPPPPPVVEEPPDAPEPPEAPIVQEPVPAEPPPPPSRDWYELARNYRSAGRDDLARLELQKIIEAGDPEWAPRARAMLDEMGEP